MARATRPAAARATFELFAVLRMTDAAERILNGAGKPVHLKEIVAQLMAGGKKFRAKKPEASVLTAHEKDEGFRNTETHMWV